MVFDGLHTVNNIETTIQTKWEYLRAGVNLTIKNQLDLKVK